MSHSSDDDYSDPLSAEERAEIESRRTERSPLKEPPALSSMAAESVQDVLATLVEPRPPYLLTTLIRQIVREEIERYITAPYHRAATRRPSHGFWEGATFHADGDTSDPKSQPRKCGE